MRIVIPDDYQDCVRHLDCFGKLAGHDVTITEGIVTEADLRLMKETALFVNTSRAELVVPGALQAALDSGRPGFAAVDVYETESVLGARHPLLNRDNVLCTPHIGYVERDNYEFYLGTAFDNLLAFAAGRPVNVVNSDMITR